MKLRLINGYPYPYPTGLSDAENDALSAAAASKELIIRNVSHFEWLHTVTVEFIDHAAGTAARELTGWSHWALDVLEAPTSAADGYAHPAIIVRDTAYCGFILERE